ncbi:MAG: peptidoglycan DD-metalloendopeptidase family protein [Clostridiales bacterium]|jgi:murein DD-endopeptidase MepM/ murein hydrolase activator NlpD|nr:peptidoglycan DD-metalloendopeptidase family protein [Clostridiales bacterium]
MFNKFSKHKRTIAIAIAVIVLLSIVIPLVFPLFTSAATLQDDLKKQQNTQKNLQEQINKAIEEKNSVTAAKKVIDQELSALEGEIDVINEQVSVMDSQIVQMQEELEQAQKTVDTQKDTYKKRIKAIYEDESFSYLDVIFEAKNINDFFYLYATMQEILEYDRTLLSKMEEAKTTIEVNKAQIEEKKAEAAESRKSLVSKQGAASDRRKQQQKLMDDLDSDQAKYEKELKAAKAAEAALKQQIAGQLSNSASSQYTGGKFAWPAPGYYTITSPYDMRTHPTLGVYKQHTGVDIGAPSGASITAAADGVVITAGWNNAYGNMVVVDHGGGYSTLYGHASKLLVTKGQRVTRGQSIAKVGSTGFSTGPHLHFEVLINGAHTNPMSYLK